MSERRAGRSVFCVDRAVHNSPPPLDDVGGIDWETFDEKDPERAKMAAAGHSTGERERWADRWGSEHDAALVAAPLDPCDPKVTGPEVYQTKELINTRQKTHGDFRDNGRVMQGMKDLARSGPSWGNLTPHQKEGVDMILHKVGRIVCGDPNWPDHWDDISGYAVRVRSFL